jgi:serpin B
MKEANMFEKRYLIASAVILCLCCGSAISVADENPVTKQDTDIVDAANQFCLDLYARLAGREENIFFSPYSIWTALAMTYEGAREQTAKEMQQTLHMPADHEMRRTAVKDLLETINITDADYELNTANALWTQKDYRFLQEYVGIIKEYYMGKVTNLDFVNDTEGSRKTINDWVAEKTRQKIKDLIPPDALTDMTRLVLTNAVYFKAAWHLQFEEAQTTMQPFFVKSEDTVSAPMMSMMDTRFPYAETPDVQILELPYGGDSLSMLIILPRTNDLVMLESMLDTPHVSAWTESLRLQKVDVYMPRFQLETKYTLNTTLSDMGMARAFSVQQANFSGMGGKGGLFISKVIHQAFVEVNEEGTEAAAATGVMMETVAEWPQTEFRADHPFVFMIRDKRTRAILFMGRMYDPS